MESLIDIIREYLCCCCRRKEYTHVCSEAEEDEINRMLHEQLIDTKSSKTEKAVKTVKIRDSTAGKKLSKVNLNERDFFNQKLTNPSDNYEKLQDLGEGAFGKVIKVRQINTGTVRAMKVMSKGSDLSEEEFQVEANTLKSLSHPNIIKVFEVYKYQGNIYLVEEFVKGGDLFSKVLKMNNLSEKITLIIMKQIFSAVYYLHFNGLIHGDLKLENIMVESLIKKRETLVLSDDKLAYDFDIKIIDFGCSTMYKKGIALTKLIGTVYYLAPEVILGGYNNKCDIWSCGVIMYILLCGKFPFNSNSTTEIFEKIKKGIYSLSEPEFKDVSKETIDLLNKCLIRDPYKRISAEEALEHPAFNILNQKQPLSQFYEDEENSYCPLIQNLTQLKTRLTFQKAIVKFITFNLVNPEEMKSIRNFYKKLDENDDGYLTPEELYNGLINLGNPVNKKEFESIIEKIDPNNTGIIEYEDFISACVDKNSILEENNLMQAFQMFDTDNSGEISVEEIKTTFNLSGKYLDEDIYKELLKELELNNQKQIDFISFKKLVQKAF